MRALFVFGALCAALLTTSARAAVTVDIPLNQQINNGILTNPTSPLGDAIYIPPSFNERLSFETVGGDSFARVSIAGGTWYYGPYIDFTLAGIPGVDISGDGCTIEFDARYFQPEANTNRYGDAPIFLRLYSYLDDNLTLTGFRDYSIVYATQAPWNNPPFPDWTHVVVDADLSTATDTPQNNMLFDPTKVTRMRMYGTDWFSPANQYGSFIDVKNFQVVCPDVIPEPGTMALMAMGALPLLGLRRRKA